MRSLLCVLALTMAAASAASEEHVVALTAETFKTEVPKDNTFVMFYAPW